MAAPTAIASFRDSVLNDNIARTQQLLPGADNIVLAWQAAGEDRALLTMEVWFGNRKRIINEEVLLGRHTTADEAAAVMAYHFGQMGMRILNAIAEDDDRAAWELTRAKPTLGTELSDALNELDQALEQAGG